MNAVERRIVVFPPPYDIVECGTESNTTEEHRTPVPKVRIVSFRRKTNQKQDYLQSRGSGVIEE
jgi:hypothetical protein